MILEQFTALEQNGKFTGSIITKFSGNIYTTVITPSCTGTDDIMGYKNIYGHCTKLTSSKNCLFITGSPNGIVACNQSVENVNITSRCPLSQWNTLVTEILVGGESIGEIILKDAMQLLRIKQSKPSNGMNIMYFLQSTMVGNASHLMSAFTEHDRISLFKQLRVECDSYQDMFWWHLIRIDLNVTKNSYTCFNACRIVSTSNIVFFTNDLSLVITITSPIIIEQQNEKIQISGSLPSKVISFLISSDDRRYKQPSISLSNGYLMSFFLRKSVQVSLLLKQQRRKKSYN